MMFKSKLYNIINDLNNHKRSKSALLSESIEERLNFALESYDKDIAESYDYLIRRDSLRVMKKINQRK